VSTRLGRGFLQRHATRSGDSAVAATEVSDDGVDGAVARESHVMFLRWRDSWWSLEARGRSDSQDRAIVARLMASQQRLSACRCGTRWSNVAFAPGLVAFWGSCAKEKKPVHDLGSRKEDEQVQGSRIWNPK